MTTLTSATTPLDPPTYRTTVRRWIDFLLLGFMLVNLALSLAAAQWSPGLDRLITITLMAVVASIVVAISDFGAIFTFFYAIITGVAAILYGLSSLAIGVASRQEAAYQIVQRSVAWVIGAFNGEPGADSMVFVLLLAILLWILSFNAVWIYFRERHKWQAILPTGLAMLVNLYYAPRDLKAYFVLYLVVAMMLLVRATMSEREAQWYEEGVIFPFDIGFDVMRDGVIFILLVVTLSWGLPTMMSNNNQDVVNPFENPWEQVKQEWHRLFKTLNYGEGGAEPSVVFTPSHPLGGARKTTDAPVMDVQTTVNRYFQATVLDTYISNGWELRNTVGVNLDAAFVIPAPDYAARRIITQTVTMRQVTNVLMGAPMPISVSVPADARLIPQGLTPEEALTAERIGAAERAMLISHAIIQPGQRYTITSAISTATESQLRSDSTVYGPDIRARYLQLPDTVPQRVFDLADSLAEGLDNPYDIAKAIESYVRQYPYNDQIPGPTPEQDAADYFLFEEKQGYCDYYATSMAVMLRHLGIPARLAQGYATGEYDPLTGAYRLLEKDAHTWVEVYFPTYGWIQFEPTSSEPVPERQTEAVVPPEPGGRASAPTRPDETSPRNIPVPEEITPGVRPVALPAASLWARLIANLGFALLALGLVGLAAVGFWLWRTWRLPRPVAPGLPRRQSSPDAMVRLWNRLLWWGRRLGVPEYPSLTPMEQAAIFAQALPTSSAAVMTLANLYARDQYSPHPLRPEEIEQAQTHWLQLRGQFIRAWLRRHLQFRWRIRR